MNEQLTGKGVMDVDMDGEYCDECGGEGTIFYSQEIFPCPRCSGLGISNTRVKLPKRIHEEEQQSDRS